MTWWETGFAIFGVISFLFLVYAGIGHLYLRRRKHPKADKQWDHFEGERYK
jgi:hypothetical protein